MYNIPMQVPTLEQLRTITQQEFLSLVVQAETEMGNEEPPELSKAKRGDPNIIKVVAKEALALAYPTYSTNGE